MLSSNPINPSIQKNSRIIGIAAFPDARILDISGPLEVFSFANLALQQEGLATSPAYSVKIFAEEAGLVKTISGLHIVAHSAYGKSDEIDTLIVPGGDDPESMVKNRVLLEWVRVTAPRVKRIASVCSGAFVLAESGLLHKKRATTHWYFCKRLAQDYPSVIVEADKIFVRDGMVSTSGGVTSGIDLALAMIEEDWGRDIALHVARYLVVFLKRPGGQSQFSNFLTHEAASRYDLRELQGWIMDHPTDDLRVNVLAERMSMSPRNFARIFLAETGVTAAKYVEMVRVDTARNYLLNTYLSIETVAEKSGFKGTETMRRAFIRNLGVNPQDYRARFSASDFDSTSIRHHDPDSFPLMASGHTKK